MAADRVTNISVPWQKIVHDAEPDFEAQKHSEIFYDYATSGHRARSFYEDPYRQGAYADQRAFILSEDGYYAITDESGFAITAEP